MTTEPKNEEAVCAAVARFIEGQRKERLTEVARPDKDERQRPAVELVLESPTARFVIEHTRIESYPQQIEDGKRFMDLLGPIETELEGKLPEGKYDLIVPPGASLKVRAADSEKVRAVIRQWVAETAPTLV